MNTSALIKSIKLLVIGMWMVGQAAFCILIIPTLLAIAYIMAVS